MRILKPTLYVVATPIGNLGDIGARAGEVLRDVAAIAAEDTRITRRLLDHLGVSTRLIALHEHNEERAAREVLDILGRGENVALVSDAGTPAISDPGSRVVALARESGYCVSPIPGANAAAAAVSVSGFASPHFLFYGFLPARAAARRQALAELRTLPYLLVFHEAPHRVADSVADLATAFGADRRILIARELTKLFEETHVCKLDEAQTWLEADANRGKGEFVLVVEGAAPSESANELTLDVEKTLTALLAELPLKQAVTLAVKITGANRNDLYERALAIKNEKGK